MGLDFKNLGIRSISGLAYAGLLIGSIILGPIAVTILASVLAVGASFELNKNTVGKDNPVSWFTTWFVDAASLVIMLFACLGLLSSNPLCCWLLIILILLRFLIQVFIDQHNPLQSISLYVFQLFYIGIPLSLLIVAVHEIINPWIVVCAISMIWISDTGAYLIGTLFGKHRLNVRLSPKKSWEGFLGGLLFNIGFAFIVFYCFHLNHPLFLSNVQGWIYIGICVTVFATLGDLFESMLKRSIGIKDFSNLIPGHGGVLDRIDSLLCVIPCVLIMIFLAVNMFGV